MIDEVRVNMLHTGTLHVERHAHGLWKDRQATQQEIGARDIGPYERREGSEIATRPRECGTHVLNQRQP